MSQSPNCVAKFDHRVVKTHEVHSTKLVILCPIYLESAVHRSDRQTFGQTARQIEKKREGFAPSC